MYEQFKNDVIKRLYGKLTIEQLREVGIALDLAGNSYTITKAETGLALRSAAGLDLVKIYSAARAVEGQSKGSIENSLYVLRAFFDTVMLPPDQVKTNDIRLYLYNYKDARGISDRSLDKVRQLISSFFSWAMSEGYIDKDPCAQIKRIKYDAKPRKALSQLELERLRAACLEDRERMIIELLYSTGCRVSEAASIRVSDINLETGEILVLGKGKKYRKVYANAKAIVMIDKHINSRKHSSEYLLESKRAPYGKLSRQQIEIIIRDIADRAGFGAGEVTPHILRHTFATTMLQNGGKVTNVQRALGHSSINTTMICAEVNDNQVREDIRRTVI